MNWDEILFIIFLFVGMIVSGVWVGLVTKYWYLLCVFVTFFLCFGIWEWISVKQTDLSISQQVWLFSDKVGITQFSIFIGSLIVSWLSLMYHFASKRLKKSEK